MIALMIGNLDNASPRARRLALALVCGMALILGGGFAFADDVDDVLSQDVSFGAVSVERTEEVIAAYPAHPRIDELRLYRLQRMMGSYPGGEVDKRSYYTQLIADFNALAAKAGEETLVAFDARVHAGNIYFHVLREPKRALAEFKKIESHPALNGEGEEAAYRKANIYTLIAESAFSDPGRDAAEAEHYARMALAYDYRDMSQKSPFYRKAYDLYERAGSVYLSSISATPAKALTLKPGIPYSQPHLYKRHQALKKEALKQVTLGQEKIEKEIFTADLSLRKEIAQVQPKTTPKTPAAPAADSAPTTAAGKPAASNPRGLFSSPAILVSILALLLLLGAAVVTVRLKRNHS